MRALALSLILAAAPAWAEEALTGEELYLDACAGCHGAQGAGDGPLAGLLTVAVPDLTGLSARHGGAFPWLLAVHSVDGRSGLLGHGGPMPVFGSLFRGDTVAADAPDGSPVMVSARVLAVVEYLEGMQR